MGSAPTCFSFGVDVVRYSQNLPIWLLLGAIALLVGCGGSNGKLQTGPSPGKSTRSKVVAKPPFAPGEHFVDLAEKWGLDFSHFDGKSGKLYFPEIMGPGAALFDYDQDGDLDIYLTQGSMLPAGAPLVGTVQLDSNLGPAGDRLFRNDLIIAADGTRTCQFVDATEEAGIRAKGYGMGVATGDFDRDGWVDLYVTNYGSNQFWRNNGDGTFTDVSKQSAADTSAWSTSAAMVDINRDGLLDLYVCNYVDFNFNNHRACFADKSGKSIYCSPTSYPAVPDRLFLNSGDGTFEDISASSQIARRYGAALGLVCADFNRDGWIDLYVANDANPNNLWINQKNNTFKDRAVESGCAVNDEGIAEGSMGVDAGDFDKDEDDDLFMTHIGAETNTLYRFDQKRSFYRDHSSVTKLAIPSRGLTGFGTAWFDFDNDSWLDLFVGNGGVKSIEVDARSQKNQLFWNQRNGQFVEVGAYCGKAFDSIEVSRAAVFGDIDNDGDTDILITNNAGPVRLLVNQLGNRKQWVGLRLIDKHGGTASPTIVEVLPENDKPLRRRARTDGSYLAANDPRVLVGLGEAVGVGKVRVHWQSGRVEDWDGVELKKYNVLREGQGMTHTKALRRIRP